MAGIGIGIILLGYSAILYGYCLIRGYNVSPKNLYSSSWPPAGKPA